MLTIKRPTSTTVLYTVSTRQSVTRITTRIQRIFLSILRVTLSLCSLCVLYSYIRTNSLLLQPYLDPLTLLPLSAHIIHGTPWTYTIPLCLATLYLCARRFYTEESLLVIRGLGVQISSSSATYLSTASTRFIPTSALQDIFLHEAFKGFEVRFYLAIVVEGEEELVVVFPKLLPKRKLLEEVWRGTKACLYEPK